MSITFEDAKPISQASTAAAEPNPYNEIIAAIAWKSDSDGTPLAKSHVVAYKTEAEVKVGTDKIARQLTKAGDALAKPGTVRRDFSPVDGSKGLKIRVTFWVVEKQLRPRKPKTEATPAS